MHVVIGLIGAIFGLMKVLGSMGAIGLMGALRWGESNIGLILLEMSASCWGFYNDKNSGSSGNTTIK
jgi:hypothetical protein